MSGTCPFKKQRLEKEIQKILLSTDIAEVDSLQVIQQRKNLKFCVTGEASISLNETPVCGSKVQGLSPYSQWQDPKKVSSE